MTDAVAVTEITAPVTATPDVSTETAPKTPETPTDDVAALLAKAKEVFGDPDEGAAPAKTDVEPTEAAAEATEGDKPAEKPAEKPVDAKTAEKIARAHRAEERVTKQLEATKAQRHALAQEREQIALERQQMQALREQYEKLKTGDPIEVMDAIGVDKMDWVKRVAATPEVVDPMGAKLAQLEARAEAAEQRRIQAERAYAEREYHQGIEEAKQGFVQRLQASAEQFPNIVKAFSPAEAAHRGLQLAAEYGAAFHQKFGRKIDDAAVAEYLDYEAEQILASRTWGNGSSASQNQQQATQSNRAATSEPADVAHTLTNSGASTALVAKRERTQEEIDAECIRILAAAQVG